MAIITAASLVGPMLNNLGLDSEMGKLFTMLSIGAGGMVFSHANDSYFWVVSKFSGLGINSTLRYFSVATAVMGLSVFLCVLLLSVFLLN